MRVAAVVVSYNSADHLGPCLDALAAQDHRPLEVTVVDNASSDGSAAVAERAAARWPPGRPPPTVVANPTNRGFAGAVNDALAATDAPAVLVCNPDARPRSDYVRRAAAALAADPRRGAVQGKLLRPTPPGGGPDVIDTTGHVAFRTRLFRNRGEGEFDRGQWDRPGPVFGVCAALALYRREMLDDVAVSVGGRREVFDEDLFAFFEDVDLDWRAAMRGWVAWYEPAAIATHERGGAGPRRTARVEELNFRNRLLVVAKCDDPRRLARDLPGVVATTALKAAELACSHPAAFVRAVAGLRLLPATLARRRAVHARAVVASAVVVDRWFAPFDYPGWVATWWRRVRGRGPSGP